MSIKRFTIFTFFMLVIIPTFIMMIGGNDGLTISYILNDYFVPVENWLEVFPIS